MPSVPVPPDHVTNGCMVWYVVSRSRLLSCTWPSVVPIGEDPAAHGHWCAFTDLYHAMPCCNVTNDKASPPGRHQEQAPKQRCTFSPTTFSSVQFRPCHGCATVDVTHAMPHHDHEAVGNMKSFNSHSGSRGLPCFAEGIHWAAGSSLTTPSAMPFTEGCPGVNDKASPPWPSSDQEQAPNVNSVALLDPLRSVQLCSVLHTTRSFTTAQRETQHSQCFQVLSHRRASKLLVRLQFCQFCQRFQMG